MNKTNQAKVVFGQGWRVKLENDWTAPPSNQAQLKKMVERSIAVEKPTATRVGGAMFKRLSASLKAPGVQMLGVYAVTELLEAIGWVMKDGAYVKIKPKEDDPTLDPNYQYKCIVGPQKNQIFDTIKLCGESYLVDHKSQNPASVYLESVVSCRYDGSPICTFKTIYGRYDNYLVATRIERQTELEPTEPETVPLTAPVLGAIMLGKDYKDPAGDTSAEKKVNTDDWTSVVESYAEDPSGVGNENSDRMDNRLKNARPTPDGKPAPIGDPRYDNNPTNEDDKTNDRKWDEPGDEATGDITPTVDPETGEATGSQSITLQFPVFCTWASTMCKWYDDWKKSDTVYKDHMTKTEEHQKDEKSFWDKVTDFFDWTKDNKDDGDQEEQEPDTSSLDKKFDTNFSANGSCPPNPAIDFPLVGTVELPFTKICDFFSFLRFGVLTGASLLACWIVASAVKGGEA
ncbi:virulence factor TspB C-terminal domain-related protein [Acinetobacter wuhouensis]|uniref:Uncharacterized protein n=1 Tax=Acinetobacter wuhouensis TaxID=1879050 RepID=A0A4Q7AF16_9GAMM|nr:virulence factor TspB C-terminal domain-related protein [Acinetobacter wuhouensis]RZG42853.1 hypothetical protein EXU28_18470 [Acinetobacter wuhouensis]